MTHTAVLQRGWIPHLVEADGISVKPENREVSPKRGMEFLPAVNDAELVIAAELLLKIMNEHLIDFDRHNMAGKIEQVLRQGAATRSDFDDWDAGILNRCAGDPLKNGRPGKKMLAETAGHPAAVSL